MCVCVRRSSGVLQQFNNKNEWKNPLKNDEINPKILSEMKKILDHLSWKKKLMIRADPSWSLVRPKNSSTTPSHHPTLSLYLSQHDSSQKKNNQNLFSLSQQFLSFFLVCEFSIYVLLRWFVIKIMKTKKQVNDEKFLN